MTTPPPTAMRVKIFATGGTFDKEYDELTGSLFFKHTHVEEVLDRGRCRLEVHVEVLMMLDSLEMTDDHRARILAACRDCNDTNIVILHGTDTMVDTAAVLAAGIPDKTIVMTGAMIPYAFGSSDGLFNLGSALSFVQALPNGVYVAMNGRCFTWDNVRKNRELGMFEPIVTP